MAAPDHRRAGAVVAYGAALSDIDKLVAVDDKSAQFHKYRAQVAASLAEARTASGDATGAASARKLAREEAVRVLASAPGDADMKKLAQ